MAITTAPEHVAIVGLGPSALQYVQIADGHGGRSAFCDEVWTVNSFGDVIAHDRLFHMDDIRIQEMRAAANPDGKIAAMLKWMKRHPGPIYTSWAHPDYPGTVDFPLEDVINSAGADYFNSTVAYALAYAIHIRSVRHLSLFGIDFTWPNAHLAEQGRACCEYWIGRANQRGITVAVASRSTLMDHCVPERERRYGYDMRDVALAPDAEGRVRVTMTPRADPPTAAEIERRYDHARRAAGSQ